MNLNLSYPGARWWRCDLHVHTYASHENSGLLEVSLKDWLLSLMKTGIDVVAITDHNTGEAIDPIKGAYSELVSGNPPGFKPLTIFPGVEISTLDSVHILALFDPSKGTVNIADLLTKLNISREKWGETDGVFTQNLTVSNIISIIDQSGALAIPAHANKNSGIFTLKTNNLRSLCEIKEIIAIENDGRRSDWHDSIKTAHPSWTQIIGSDLHTIPDSQTHTAFTWIKMGEPTLEGLVLALLDGRNSVRRSGEVSDNFSVCTHPWIRSTTITDTRYMGKASSFISVFNPGLNAIVGGRGTGKSSLVEFIRIVSGRVNEIPEKLKEEFQKYISKTSDNSFGLLQDTSIITLEYEKDQVRYRIQWRNETKEPSIFRILEDGSEIETPGDIKSRFPVAIYSQKQIYEMARQPSSILAMIDQDSDIGYHAWEEKYLSHTSRYRSLRAKIREIIVSLPDKNRLDGELEDVLQKISLFEKTGYAEILHIYQQTVRSERNIEIWEESWNTASESIRTVISQIGANDPDVSMLDPVDPTEAVCIHELLERTRMVNETIADLKAVAENLEDQWQSWTKKRNTSEWQQKYNEGHARYATLTEELSREGIHDIKEYGILIQKKETILEQIRSFDSLIQTLDDYKKQERGLLSEILQHRLDLTKKRKDFIKKNLKGVDQVIMRILPFGDRRSAEAHLREVLGIDGERHSRFINIPDGDGGIIGRLYAGYDTSGRQMNVDDFITRLHNENQRIYDLCDGKETSGIDQRYVKSLLKCSPEQLDNLAFWFPDDSLYIGYREGEEGEYRDLSQGSPGQKNAAILSFILSYGSIPLILDQPEDDLDNHLIYNLIVKLIQKTKEKRQIIVVTHNANIVVNGNADYIVPLKAEGEDTIIYSQGLLQDKEVREEICHLMEGGKTAFEQRYKRILKDLPC